MILELKHQLAAHLLLSRRGVIARTDRYAMYGRPGDRRAHRLMRHGGSLQPGLRSRWVEAVAAIEPDLVLDVGANYGEMLLPLERVNARQLVAVEPNPLVHPYLTQSIRSCAGLRDRASVVPAAVGAFGETETVSLSVHLEFSGTTRLARLPPAAAPARSLEVEVKAIRLSDLVPSGTGSLALKMDIEGAETAALRELSACSPSMDDVMILLEVEHINLDEVAALIGDMEVFAVDQSNFAVRHAGRGTDIEAIAPSVRSGQVHDVFVCGQSVAGLVASAWNAHG